MTTRRSTFAGAALGLWLAAAAAAQDYPIRLDRPVKPGEKHRLEAKAVRSLARTTAVSGRVVQRRGDAFALEIDSVVTVIETDARGGATKESHAVARCVQIRGDARRELFPKGTVLLARATEHGAAFEVDGAPVAEEVGDALRLVISLSTGGATDDDVFGTQERQVVGGSWGIHAEVAARDLARRGIAVDAKSLSGRVNLIGAVDVGGTGCLDIRGEMTGEDVVPPLPKWAKVERSTLRCEFAGKFPLDLSLPRVEESMSLTMILRAQGRPAPGAPEQVIDLTMSQRATSRRERLD
jgi:hypothetical protein